MVIRWSFSRSTDSERIETEIVEWFGPYSWPGFENSNGLGSINNVKGVCLFTFKYNDGFLIYSVGITNSTKIRIATHTREYRKGNYNVLDINSAEQGERKEIWHGWTDARKHREEFVKNKKYYSKAIENQLKAFRLFIAEIPDKRKRERMEFAIMQNIYLSKEPWSELADRGMFLQGRYNYEMPINIGNRCECKIYGLTKAIEI